MNVLNSRRRGAINKVPRGNARIAVVTGAIMQAWSRKRLKAGGGYSLQSVSWKVELMS
jgi:hypothetical protein